MSLDFTDLTLTLGAEGATSTFAGRTTTDLGTECGGTRAIVFKAVFLPPASALPDPSARTCFFRSDDATAVASLSRLRDATAAPTFGSSSVIQQFDLT